MYINNNRSKEHGKNALQELMYSEPSRYAFLFQSYVQLTMLQLHTCKTPSPYKIMERSVYSAMCFVENLKRRNVLRDVEVTILENWYDWCLENANNIETDLIGTYVIYGFCKKLLQLRYLHICLFKLFSFYLCC